MVVADYAVGGFASGTFAVKREVEPKRFSTVGTSK